LSGGRSGIFLWRLVLPHEPNTSLIITSVHVNICRLALKLELLRWIARGRFEHDFDDFVFCNLAGGANAESETGLDLSVKTLINLLQHDEDFSARCNNFFHFTGFIGCIFDTIVSFAESKEDLQRLTICIVEQHTIAVGSLVASHLTKGAANFSNDALLFCTFKELITCDLAQNDVTTQINVH